MSAAFRSSARTSVISPLTIATSLPPQPEMRTVSVARAGAAIASSETPASRYLCIPLSSNCPLRVLGCCSSDELDGHQDLPHRQATPCFGEELDRRLGHLGKILADGGQPLGDDRQVVEADERDVMRNAKAGIFDRGESAERQ